MANISQDQSFLDMLPSKWWVKFFKKFDEIDTVPPSQWKEVHLLSFFARKFEDHYGQRFSFDIKKKAPGKSSDIWQIKQIQATLGTTNNKTTIDYISWVFKNKINGKKIRSIGFLVNPAFCNEYKLYKAESEKINRATELPMQYKEIINEFGLSLETFGELSFVKSALDEDPENEFRKPYSEMFNKLYSVGFDYAMIKNLR